MFTLPTRARGAAIALAAVTLLSSISRADEQSFSEMNLEELMNEPITAQKRAETVQSSAMAITVFPGDVVRELDMQTAWDLAEHTPNLQLTSFYGNSRVEFVLRGVSLNNLFGPIDQPPVGVYNDEVYVGARDSLTQMFDLERIEVLRGPQGTLYGRNTTGGAVNFIERKPSSASNLTASVTYGRFGELDAELAAGMPLSETAAVRAAGVVRRNDGFALNLATGERAQSRDDTAGRVLLSLRPSDALDMLFKIHASSAHGATGIHNFGLGQDEPNPLVPYQEDGDFQHLSNDRPGFERNDGLGAAWHTHVDLGKAQLTTILSYDELQTSLREDTDGTPFDIFTIDWRDQFRSWSVEQRAAMKVERGPLAGLDWIAGVYYYEDRTRARNEIRLFLDPAFDGTALQFARQQGFSRFTQDSDNWAVFSDAALPLGQQTSLNVGARYSSETKDFDLQLSDRFGDFVPTQDTQSWHAVTGRAVLQWRPHSSLLAYGGYSRGFKSGGFSGLLLAPPLPGFTLPNLSFAPELIDAYEIGVKSSWMEQQLTANLALFHSKLEDQQFLVVEPGIIFTVQNAAASTIDGAELELNYRPTRALHARLGVGLLDAQFDEFLDEDGTNHAGNPLPATSKVNVNGLVEYTFTLAGGHTLTPRVHFVYYSKQNYDRYGNKRVDLGSGLPIPAAVDVQPAYTVVNTALTWESSARKYAITAWVRNLTDEEYFFKTIGNNADSAAGVGGATSYHAAPRTYGLTATFSLE
jgi:iron complex outermembrane receptor protein